MGIRYPWALGKGHAGNPSRQALRDGQKSPGVSHNPLQETAMLADEVEHSRALGKRGWWAKGLGAHSNMQSPAAP